MQKSVLKVNECRTFSASGCQGVSGFPTFKRDKILVSDLITFSAFNPLTPEPPVTACTRLHCFKKLQLS